MRFVLIVGVGRCFLVAWRLAGSISMSRYCFLKKFTKYRVVIIIVNIMHKFGSFKNEIVFKLRILNCLQIGLALVVFFSRLIVLKALLRLR